MLKYVPKSRVVKSHTCSDSTTYLRQGPARLDGCPGAAREQPAQGPLLLLRVAPWGLPELWRTAGLRCLIPPQNPPFGDTSSSVTNATKA